MKRKILELVNVTEVCDLSQHGFKGNEIKRVWTLYDEKMEAMLLKDPSKLQTIPLKHNRGVFLEEKVHDWCVDKDNIFRYYSRVVESGKKINVIFEMK